MLLIQESKSAVWERKDYTHVFDIDLSTFKKSKDIISQKVSIGKQATDRQTF